MVYRAALVGCGNIGSTYANDPLIRGIYTHAGAYDACPRTNLVAVCDSQRERAEACATRWKVSAVYSDTLQLLEEQQPEIVSICTPNETHAAMLDLVLDAPRVRAVLIEKPLAVDVDSAARLVRLAKDRGIVLAVNYSRRYSKGHARVKAFIQSGGIGRVQSVSGFYTKGIFHNGTHWLDLAHFLIGDIQGVQGFNLRNRQEYDGQVDCLLKFENGTTGFLQGLDTHAYTLFEMDILGIKGRVRLSDSGHRIEYFEVANSPHYSGYKTLKNTSEQDGEMNDTVLHALWDLIDCLDSSRMPLCSGVDGFKALQVASLLLKSVEVGRSISLSE